jgi:hypothetical protein
MTLMAAMVGVVEFCALTDFGAAQDVARKFAEHDPFQPRLPWDIHVIFVFGFVLLLGGGLHLILRRKGHGTFHI